MSNRPAHQTPLSLRSARIECEVLDTLGRLKTATVPQIKAALPGLTVWEVRSALQRQEGVCVEKREKAAYTLID